jgi:hypothetical protein
VKVLLDGQPALVVGQWHDFDDAGFDLLVGDEMIPRWISMSGARVRIKSLPEEHDDARKEG